MDAESARRIRVAFLDNQRELVRLLEMNNPRVPIRHLQTKAAEMLPDFIEARIRLRGIER
jgi:hypothetical protein